jgi:hypothetical protein
VSFAAITFCVVSERVFVVVSLLTQSGKFCIHPRLCVCVCVCDTAIFRRSEIDNNEY